MKNSDTIQNAEFNSGIKTYMLIYVAFFLFITIVGIPLLIFWFLGIGQYFSKRFYDNLKCTLTDRHLEFKKGVLFKVEKTIPLENIQNLTFIENPLLKLLDLQILKIETAGQSTPNGSDMKLIGIVDPAAFKEKVLNQRAILISENRNENKVSVKSDDSSIVLLKEIKEILIDIRNK